MRSVFIVALLATVIGAAFYFYQVGAAICAVPIAYHIGTIDPEFAITAAEVRAAAKRAEESWEESTGRELFEVTEGRGVAINLEFDERHQRFLDVSALATDLDAAAETNDAILAEYELLRERFEADRATYESATASYQAGLSDFNETVRAYNSNGGVPPDQITELEKVQERLEQERQVLNRQATELREIVSKINALQVQGVAVIEDYNDGVEVLKETLSESRPFDGAFYRSGGDISIFAFGSVEEMTLILAHEFGHALGIDHVDNPASVMYTNIKEQNWDDQLSAPVLTEQDQAAFNDMCAERSPWDTIVTGIKEALTPHYEH